jgi:hypothetical protein
MDLPRIIWNKQQKGLRAALSHPEQHDKAIDLFLSQHAMIHSADMSGTELFSFEDEIWQGLEDRFARYIPPKFEHSIAWCIWHLTRCEDITMNMLVAGAAQLLQKGWLEKMRVPECDTGNAMKADEMANFNAKIEITDLRGYRRAVGRRTREIIRALKPGDFKRKIDPQRIQQIREEGAVLASQQWLLDYWGGQTIAGLLLMPPTRHSMVHLNEALRIKQKVIQE